MESEDAKNILEHREITTNREHKSRLFQFLFGREERKIWTLSLYNALNRTDYDNPDAIELTTIDDVVYMGIKNDISYMVTECVSLYRTMNLNEQQSTYNPNMPLREFMYCARLFDKYVKANHVSIYSSRLLPLPIPKLITFYNGKSKQEDDFLLKLSDSFREEIRRNILKRDRGMYDKGSLEKEIDAIMEQVRPDVEVTVRMININQTCPAC